MASVQFFDIGTGSYEMLVYGFFSDGHELIVYGDAGLAEVLTRIDEDNHAELKMIYDDVVDAQLTGFKISFEIDESGSGGVSELKAVVDDHEFFLGNYFVYAEGGGAAGLRTGVTIREKQSAEG